ncbi:MAG TPA: apolipoprotein N-acyltransferase [Acidimicrobiales bacterium]|nr:apolipoprotein N-acyltransferase [Acidimicrobiales bacterium]
MLPRLGRVLAPSLLGGLLLAFSLPPWGWWPLALVGAGTIFWRLAGLPWHLRLLAGWAAGMGCFVPGLWWAAAFNWYGGAVLMVVEALSMALAAVAVPPGRWRTPAFVGAFTLAEALRVSWPFGGLPLGGVFLGQAAGPLLDAARLGGPLLLTALVWLGGAGLATSAGAASRAWTGDVPAWRLAGGSPWRRAGGAPRPASSAVGTAAVALVAAAGVGGLFAPAGGAPARTVTVALVQGGGRRGVSHFEVAPETVLAAQVAASSSLLDASDPPGLVVWPEDVVRVGAHLAGTRAAADLSSLSRRLHSTVLAGVTETVSATAFRNEVVAWGPSGRVVGTYEKVHRVPFGEYVPDRSLFAHLANLVAVPLDAVPGHGSGELTTAAGRLGLMVSFEVFFATRGRSATRAGAQLLVVPTNTSSYATSQVPTLEIAADRLQAVEEGRDLVQAAPTGYSTVVAPNGAVLAHTSLGRRQVLRATVVLRSGRTVYEQLGDVPVLALAGACLLAGVALGALGVRGPSRRHRRRRRWSRS